MEIKHSIQNCDTKNDNSSFLNYSSMVHSKKVVKHALRQQVKRRRKNTTIAAGNHRPITKVIHSLSTTPITTDLPLAVLNDERNHIVVEEAAVTMKEVLASLPGFSVKSNRRRSTKKLSVAAQLEAGLVDLESPASILTNTSLRSLLNRHTFQGLPPLYQRKLAQLLPAVDRQDAAISGLNNEFFARACQEWRKRLAEGEFTPENQQRLKIEAEKDKNRLDPWKLKHFEPIWGEKREIHKLKIGLHCINKEQRFFNTSTRSNLGSQIESNLDSVLRNHQSSDLSTLEKEEENISLFSSNKLHETHSNLMKDQRIMPKFNVTVQILDDEDDDDENDEEDEEDDEEDDEDEDEDDEDDEEDDNDDDEEEEDDEEDEDEDDEIDTQVSLAYLEEESQHCRAIIVTNNSEELFDQGQITTEIPVIEQRKYSKEMILDFINDKKFLEVDLKVKEQKCDLRGRNIERSLKSSIKEFKYVTSDTYGNIFEKPADYFHNKNEEHMCKLSEECLEPQTNSQIYHNAVSKLKFIVKDESLKNEPLLNMKAVENEKSTCDSDICSSETEISNCVTNNLDAEVAEVIEIDNETLQRIHELEVQGEMQEAYQEISNCHEEIIYPILEDIEMNADDTKDSSTISEAIKNREINSNVINKTQEEAFQEANNYVCSEMLDCTWTSNINENSSINLKDKNVVSWPQTINTTDDKILSTNFTISNISDSNDSETFINQNVSLRDEIPSTIEDSNSFSCIQLPVTAFSSDSLRLTPVTSCLMKNVHTTQSSSVITFPQIQSIRFVQTNFQTTIEHNSNDSISNAASLCAQIQSSTSITQQSHNNVNSNGQDGCKNKKNVEFEIKNDSEFVNRSSNILSGNSGHQNLQTQSTVVLQQQTLLPLSSRPLIAMQSQQQSHYPMMMNMPCKVNRNTGLQNTHRSSRCTSKEQNNGRSRNVSKEPPGAVNFERSYQICQAVIASSPNREQLKAHLKPPPSLLTKTENSHNNNKFNTRSCSTNRTQKNFHFNQGGLISSNRSQGVTVKHIITTSHQTGPEEIIDGFLEDQIESNNFPEIGHYICLKKSGINESVPRASSAPPIPPKMSLIKVGSQIVHGRPASADERSYESFSLKLKRNSVSSNDGVKLESSNMIMGEMSPSTCECNIQEAMIICRQCGAFCHHNCISPQYVCAICLVG